MEKGHSQSAAGVLFAVVMRTPLSHKLTDDRRFYREMVPAAQKQWTEYLRTRNSK